MTFLNQLGAAMNRTTTENGAPTLLSSQNPLVDFFALAGSTRKNPGLGLDLFKKAFSADHLMAIRILFYLRDIRGGQGERELFRNCLHWLANEHPEISAKVVNYVPEYGRWDDLFILRVEDFLGLVKTQLEKDVNNDNVSLLAKWLPSENTSSQNTRTFARGMQRALGMSSKEYRKMLSYLRAKIKLVEHKLSNKEFSAIEYDKVPSQASLKYRKAFSRNDGTRYVAYLESVKKGEKKINTSTLYPYQVYNAARSGGLGSEEMWANLPDYTNGKNAIVVADVSGSMIGEPMSVSVSLALYFAERNQGPFKDHFITFSSNPNLQKIVGATLREKIASLESAHWEMNTDLFKVFKLILDTAVRNNASADELPQTIYIISDMEFDVAAGHPNKTNFEAISDIFAQSGYKLPNLVFWNVQARNKQVPVDSNTYGVTLVSGLSASTFKWVVENKTPEQLMLDVINSDRYAAITI